MTFEERHSVGRYWGGDRRSRPAARPAEEVAAIERAARALYRRRFPSGRFDGLDTDEQVAYRWDAEVALVAAGFLPTPRS